MPINDDDLKAIVVELLSKPKHEKVRSLVYKLLTDGLGAKSTEISFEHGFEVRGRIDALLGSTAFEFKSDVQAEMRAVQKKMPEYIEDREKSTGRRFIGIATDGAEFIVYRLANGLLETLTTYKPQRNQPRGLLDWLGQIVAIDVPLEPTADIVRRELGRDSLAYTMARSELSLLWQQIIPNPDAILKRELWSSLLEKVYGSKIDSDDLWFQHTYLTIVAKAMALQILGLPVQAPREMLDGTPFRNAGIGGAVESDFFEWVLNATGGPDVVRQIVSQANRFKLDKVEHDVLKDLYESLIDPDQRHDLGEYYTPDWLAAEVHETVVSDPLKQRVLDPSCGSGTFLFHAVRAVLAAAQTGGLSNAQAVELCTNLVYGIDIHPVAVIIARVVFLMAIGEQRLQQRNAFTIPVYLGDSLQWNTQTILTQTSIQIDVPGGSSLYFPASATTDPAAFDSIIDTMLRLSEAGAANEDFRAWLQRNRSLSVEDQGTLVATYAVLRELQSQKRNHVWGYVARNLSRPIWLSSGEQKVDRIVGNPPWLSYRFMSDDMQTHFRNEAARLGVSSFGQGSSSQQDLSTYFVARCVELYLKPAGKIGFILPYAVLSRKQYRKFLTGNYASKKRLGIHRSSAIKKGLKKRSAYRESTDVHAQLSFDAAWTLTKKVQPVFRVPSCVLFGTSATPTKLPTTVTDFSGTLPRRDATRPEAKKALMTARISWPEGGTAKGGYAATFRAGAIIFPVVFFRVQKAQSAPLGVSFSTPVVESKRSRLEKKPWKNVKSLRGPVEASYLYELMLGESIAPFSPLKPSLAVIPRSQTTGTLMDSAAARSEGALNLSGWMNQAEKAWKKYAKAPQESLAARLDFYGQLSSQFPIPAVRLVYSASGTRLSAAVLTNTSAVVEHKLYWAEMETLDEARYLEAILNSEITRRLIQSRQSQGLWGPRDFDKVVFLLPIPPYEGSAEQIALIKLAARAEHVASTIVSGKELNRVKALKLIRTALGAAGIAALIDERVKGLLGVP